jgi:hypothetical protein
MIKKNERWLAAVFALLFTLALFWMTWIMQ